MRKAFVLIGLIILLIFVCGCTATTPDDYGCVPITIEEKYKISGGNCPILSGAIVPFCGVAIVSDKAYIITDKSTYDFIEKNKSYSLKLTTSSIPDYNSFSGLCKEVKV